jgi:serine/threonine-protein kinase
MSTTAPLPPDTTNPAAVDHRFTEDLVNLTRVGRYEIQSKIGHGGNGMVFLGADPYIQRNVAIKIAQPLTDKARRTFFLEAQSAGRLQHPGIVTIFDAGTYKTYCYIAMEFVDGHSLEAHCAKEHLLPIPRVVETIFQICQSLDYAHQQKIIHRDIKPSNILLDADGTPKIADFGIAQLSEQTSEMGIWGTPSYMAPEQLKEETIGNTSDIFSLGCVLYELLCGQRAFLGENNFAIMYKITHSTPPPVESVRPEIPPILADITRKAMAKDRRDRYQTCLDFAYDLRVALRGLTQTEAPDDPVQDVIDLIHNVPFFSDFSQAHLKELASDATVIRYPVDTVIVDEGDIDDTFYVMLSGRTRIVTKGRVIATVGVGECFGEMAFIAGQARSASAIADTDCIVMKISATFIDRASESVQLLFYKNFATTLVRRLSSSPTG